MKDIKPAVAVVVALTVGGAGFYGGIVYQKSRQPNFPAGMVQMRDRSGAVRTGQPIGMMQRGGGFSGGMAAGEVISRDENSITVKMRDGSSKIVILSASTTYSKSQETTAQELKTGSSVAVFGAVNTDGTITATSIQVNPEMRNFPSPTTNP